MFDIFGLINKGILALVWAETSIWAELTTSTTLVTLITLH